MIRQQFLSIALTVVIATGLAGCGGGGNQGNGGNGGGGGGGNALQAISITPIGPGVGVGGTTTLKATGHFSDGTTQDLTSTATWSADNTSVATVSSGTVTGVGQGVATITATSGSVSGATAVSVTTMTLGNSALNGNYAFLMSLISNGKQGWIAGSFTANGQGQISGGNADVNAGGAPVTNTQIGSGGTYSVYPDGRGTVSFSINGTTFKLAFVLYNLASGVANKGKFITIDSNKAYGTFEKQAPSLSLTGTYVFALTGLDPSGILKTTVGRFDAAAGVIQNGARDADTGGSVSPNNLFTGSFAGGNTANGRGTISLGHANYAFYVVSSNKVFLAATDPGADVMGGTAELQSVSGRGFGLSSLSGNFAFLLDHGASDKNGTFERSGTLSFDGAGGISAGVEDNDASGMYGQTLSAGTYTVDSTGRGTLHAPNSAGGALDAIFYIVSPGRMYMMSTEAGAPSPGIGTADAVQSANLNPAGSMALSLTELGEVNVNEVGLMAVSSNALSGIAVVNSNGAGSAGAIKGTLSAGSGGRTTGTITIGSQSTDIVLYATSPGSGIVVGVNPDVDGRLDPQ